MSPLPGGTSGSGTRRGRPRAAELRAGRVQAAGRLASHTTGARKGRRGGGRRPVPPLRHHVSPRRADVLLQRPLAALGRRGDPQVLPGVAADVARRSDAHTLKIEPEIHADDARTLLDSIGFRDARYDLNFDTTVTVDLSMPEDELLANMRKSTLTASASPPGKASTLSSPRISRRPGTRSTTGWRTRPSASPISPSGGRRSTCTT